MPTPQPSRQVRQLLSLANWMLLPKTPGHTLLFPLLIHGAMPRRQLLAIWNETGQSGPDFYADLRIALSNTVAYAQELTGRTDIWAELVFPQDPVRIEATGIFDAQTEEIIRDWTSLLELLKRYFADTTQGGLPNPAP